MSAEQLLTENETAELLKISRKTLANWRWRGEGPTFVRVGHRMIRYRRSELEAFLRGDSRGEAA